MPTESPDPVPLADPYSPPLSKVNVHNSTDQPVYVKLLWPQGFQQLFRVESNATSFLTGAVGVVAGPPQLEVLTVDCEVIEALAGDSDPVLVIVSDAGAELIPINRADRLWTNARVAQDCGVTIAP